MSRFKINRVKVTIVAHEAGVIRLADISRLIQEKTATANASRVHLLRFGKPLAMRMAQRVVAIGTASFGIKTRQLACAIRNE
jgi:hypothetical protein